MPNQYLTLIEQEKAPPAPQRGRRALYVDTLGILREEDYLGRLTVIGSGLGNTSATTVKIGTVTTGVPGSDAIVTNSGTDTAVVLNFTIPAGADGDPGVGVPAGGTTGQVLAKNSNTDFDTGWITVGITDGDKGDITVSGSGATWTIDTAAVTYAKIQDVSSTQRVLGRNTSGAGDVEEVTFTQLLDWVGSAAQGDILYRGAASWARLGAGTSGHALFTQGPGANPVWGSIGSSGRLDVQVFGAGSGNWTKPAGANPNAWASVLLISGGGGGGSGRRGALGSVRGGGGGGASGNVVRIDMRVAALGSTEAYIVGAGGAGGTSPPTNNTNGNTGTQGGTSTFSIFTVIGGAAGFGGSTSGGSGGSSVVGHTFVDNLVSQSQSGGAGASSVPSNAGGSSAIWLMSAGGGGGSVTAGNLNAAGAAGGSLGAAAQYGGIAGGTAGAAGGANGGTVAAISIKAGYGVGGGGGGGNNAGVGGNGGNGGGYGSGGGGGGGATDGNLPGAGGNGGDGVLIVVTPLT